ncbi:ADP-ribosylglycohydrolase family protein [Streptomyces sp. NPDC003038]|uniref:ADP-ribosylglycohydrolase family protein n=1 Tax=unclassified Streptomyces TaxID=2593676 RepID=UPI0033A0E5AC
MTAPSKPDPPDRPPPSAPGPATAFPSGTDPRPPTGADDLVRLTWAQPEDLIGHELRQATEDGRDPEAVRRAWLAAGGHPAPERAGASPAPAPPELRALAGRLLDELARLPSPGAADEPESWAAIQAAWPRPGRHPAEPHTDTAGRSVRDAPRPAKPRLPRPPAEAAPGAAAPARADARTAGPSHDAPARTPAPAPAPAAHGPAQPEDPGPPDRAPAGHPLGLRQAMPRPEQPGHGGPGSAATAVRPAQRGAARSLPAGRAYGRDPRLLPRLEASWLGRAAGCLLGKPVEKLPLAGIRALARAAGNWPLGDWFTARRVPPELLAAYPWNRRSAPTSLAENIDGMPEDDDLNYPLLDLLLLQRHGKGFTTADVGRLWLGELPAGRTFTAERVAYRNLLLGLEPPATATHHNPFREWIGALIRADVHGWTHPGEPAAAAAQAYRDAALTHTGNGLYAALFTAAAIAEAATGRADVHAALRAGLTVVPPRSRLAEAVRFGIRAAVEEEDFDRVVDRLHERYGHYHWVHAVPNTALIAAALTHADGDFTHSICRAVSGGWDTDSNGATAGSLAGLLAGSPENLPHRWTAPLKNRLATTVPGFDGIGFDTLAHLTAQEAARS